MLNFALTTFTRPHEYSVIHEAAKAEARLRSNETNIKFDVPNTKDGVLAIPRQSPQYKILESYHVREPYARPINQFCNSKGIGLDSEWQYCKTHLSQIAASQAVMTSTSQTSLC